MQSITLQPIETDVELKCPHCNQPIYRVLPNDSEVIRGGYWLRDGDTISGFYNALTDEQKQPNGFDCGLVVGSQACCEQDYYVVECQLIDAEFERDEEGYLIHFFEQHFYGESAEIVNFTAHSQGKEKLVIQEWIVTQAPSPKGIIQSHLFGPFPLLEDISGSYGVVAYGNLAHSYTWTHGRNLLLTLWNDLRVLARAANQNPELTITTIAAKQPEEKEQEQDFSQSTATEENFEWFGQGAMTLGLATTVAEAPECEV